MKWNFFMRVELLLIIIALFLGISTVNGQETSGPYRAGDLSKACYALTQNVEKESWILAAGEGLCAGAISTTMRFGPMMNDQFKFCPPPGITPEMVIPILLKFLDKNPKAVDYDLRDLANYVGRVTWPCK